MKILIFIAWRYFNQNEWYTTLEIFHQKEKSGWTCLACHKRIGNVISERCQKWCHLSCTNPKRPPKSRNQFCKVCMIMFT